MTSLPLLNLLMLAGLPIKGVLGMGLDLETGPVEINDLTSDSERAILLTTGFNLTNLLPLVNLVAAAFLPIVGGLSLAAIILSTIAAKDFKQGGYDGYSSSYSSDYSRSLGLTGMDWERLTLVDLASVLEEVMQRFDPGSLDCQKRVICELHQNNDQLGFVAQRAVQLLGYLRYASVLNLPEMVQTAISEYLEASERGRSMSKDCGDIYTECDFSIKMLSDRHT